MIEGLPKNKKLILFDGVCNLCNAAIQYVIRYDKKDLFRYAPLQSNIGQKVIAKYNIDVEKTDSILLYSEAGGLSIKSSAALNIAKHLGFPRNLMVIFFYGSLHSLGIGFMTTSLKTDINGLGKRKNA